MKDAYATIEHLPPHVTFGGLNNQRLREKGKITRMKNIRSEGTQSYMREEIKRKEET